MSIKRELSLGLILLTLALGLLTLKPVLAGSFLFNKNLSLGSISNDVKELQKYFNANGFIIAKTGPGSKGSETTYFGALTKAALIKFQKANKIKPSVGYFGPITRDFINKKIIKQNINNTNNNNTNNTNNTNNNNNNNLNNTTNNTNYYTLGGTVTGLISAITLQNNNQDDLTITPGNNSLFTFPTKLINNTSYNITIKQNYLGQSCHLENNSGIINSSNVTNIKITCSSNAYPSNSGGGSGVAIYTLTYTAGANGTITGTTPQTVYQGNNASPVTAIPNTGYYFVSWSDGVLTAQRTDTNVIGNISVTATFAINTYTLTYTAASHGSITGTTSQTINYGSDGTAVTATPDTGYYFVSWSDGVLTAARTDTNIIANKSVTATFAINSYTITSSAGAHGTITPTATVNYGSNKTFTITPDTGYLISDVLVDTVSVGTPTTYTFTNVTTTHTISVTFAIAFACGTSTVSYGGEDYPTVQIGSQCWLAKNLDIGTMVTSGNSEPNCHDVSGNGSNQWSCQINNSLVEKYCYSNDSANCTNYGGLYEWSEAMNLPYDCNNSVITDNGSGTYTLVCPISGNQTIQTTHQGICPTGWHIPSFNEYQTLAQVVDDNHECIPTSTCSTAGGKLKASASHTPIVWDGTDNYGFSALPSGYRNNMGAFALRGSRGYFWSKVSILDTPFFPSNIYFRSNVTNFYSINASSVQGQSIRCIKD